MSTSLAKSGPNPLLAKYLAELAANPLRTKALTSATLCFFQEVIGSSLARLPPSKVSKDAPFIAHVLARSHIDTKALKMALYGFLVSAPLSHYLVGALQKAFQGKSGLGARTGQIVASNLVVSPAQVAAYLASIAIINGAKSAKEVVDTVRGGFLSVIRIQWLVSPVAMAVAQRFISPQLWVPYFNLLGFVMGTYFNFKVKRMRLAAIAKDKKDKDERPSEEEK